MKFVGIFLLGIALLLCNADVNPDKELGFRRFALVVGANDGGSSRVKLRYANTDASTFSNVLVELGGVSRDDMVLLKEPTLAQFLAAMQILRGRIANAKDGGWKPELLVYFSGHSDENGLMFGAEKLSYPDFRSRIDAAPAKIRLAVVDACASGALTRIKGGSRLPAFSVDESANLSGYAFLTASSGTESAQESERIRASYFTHFLVTGLRGAADRNQDGKVTLGEAYEFAFQETLAQTEGSQAGAQHPSYDMRLTGTGDLVLTDLRGTSAGLVMDAKMEGRLFVRAASGALVAELQKTLGRNVELGLEPGMYDISLKQGGSLFRALVNVEKSAHLPVSMNNFTPVAKEKTQSRGGTDSLNTDLDTNTNIERSPIQRETWIPFRAAIVPSVGYPGTDSVTYSHNVSLNLLVGKAFSIQGLQLCLGLNKTLGNMNGLQCGMVNSSEGGSKGLQFAILFNSELQQHCGVQISGLVNAVDTLEGLQIGMVNYTGIAKGLQLGLLNISNENKGLQAGVINVDKESEGIQVGLINYAKHSKGGVIGLINLIGNGMHNVEMTFDERSMLRTAFLLGGPHNYNYFSFDMKGLSPHHLWGGSAGIGMHFPRKPFFADADLGVGIIYNDQDMDNTSYHSRLRLFLGYSPIRYFSIFGGMNYNAEIWDKATRPNLNPNRDGENWFGDYQGIQWNGFFLGIRI